jgi:linoleate 10R-lipoxygenase
MGAGRLQRGADGAFADDDIARIIVDAMVEPAAAFGARGTPEWMRVVGALRSLSGDS